MKRESKGLSKTGKPMRIKANILPVAIFASCYYWCITIITCFILANSHSALLAWNVSLLSFCMSSGCN